MTTEPADRPDTGEDYAVQTIDISKHFGAVRAVDELTVSIPRKGITSIVGPNGSGKSTFVNLLSGVLPLDGGMVILDGVSLRVVHAHDVPSHGADAHVPGGAALRPDQRVGQHHGRADQPPAALRAPRTDEAGPPRRGRAHLKLVGDVGEARLTRHGPLVRPAQAARDRRALALDVQIYMFDEPFAGLFPQMIEPVKDLVRDLRDRGRTIIFISHNMDIVRELPDHLIVLDSGTLLTEGDVQDVLSREEVIEAYLGT